MTALPHRPLIRPMPDSPRVTPAKHRERAAREARLAEALRDNLRKRKAQARAAKDEDKRGGGAG